MEKTEKYKQEAIEKFSDQDVDDKYSENDYDPICKVCGKTYGEHYGLECPV